MKIQFTNFGGGILTGLALCWLLSFVTARHPMAEASLADNIPDVAPSDIRFVKVSIDTFFRNASRYRNTHCKIVYDRMPKPVITTGSSDVNNVKEKKFPSRMFIYSVPTLEKFFNVIRQCAQDAGISNDMLAIRFYYAVYPRKMDVAHEDYSSLHTLYMVPNYWDDGERKFKDLDIAGLGEYVRKHKPKRKELASLVKKYYLINRLKEDRTARAFMLDATAVEYTGPYPVKVAGLFPFASPPEAPPVINQGQLCPPNCPTESLLDHIDAEYTEDW